MTVPADTLLKLIKMKKIWPILLLSLGCTLVLGQTNPAAISLRAKQGLVADPENLVRQMSKTAIRFAVKGKQVIIDDQEAILSVEGYDGDDLIIEPEPVIKHTRIATPPMGSVLITPGLRDYDNVINYTIMKNETGLFSIRLLSVYDDGRIFRHYHVKVPKKTHLKVIFVMSELGAKMSFKNLSNELEVEGTAPIIEFGNITGPLTLSEGIGGHRIGGTEKVIVSHLQIPKNDLDNNEDTPFLNIITSYGDVDIALPGETRATVQVDARYGNLYSDLDLVKQRPAFPMVKNRYTGNLNGGGKMIVINATYGNVYLRKDK